MKLDLATVGDLTRPINPVSWLRLSPYKHAVTPLGMGWSDTRFSSPLHSFQVLYLAKDLPTAISETVIRDRFEGDAARQLMMSEITAWGLVEIVAAAPLLLLDVRTVGCLTLGVSTDIKGAKGQVEARQFSQSVYDQSSVDGIIYKSRLTGTDCIAVYDRGVCKLSAKKMVKLVGVSTLVPSLTALRVNLIS